MRMLKTCNPASWLAWLPVVCLAAAVAVSAPLLAQSDSYHWRQGRFVEFDAPGAATTVSPNCGTGCGTVAYANDDWGDSVGFYTDANVVPHGFLRTRDGRFISFDAPGTGLGAGLNQGTAAFAINDLGGGRRHLSGFRLRLSRLHPQSGRFLHHLRRARRRYRCVPGHLRMERQPVG